MAGGEHPEAPRLRAETLVVWAATAALYLATRAQNHAETQDSLPFANRIRDGATGEFFEGPHLVFDWIGWAWYRLVDGLGLTSDAVVAVSVLDALLAAVAVALVWRLLRHLGADRVAALAGAGLLAGSYAFWRTAIDVEVFALASLLVVVALDLLLRAVELRTRRSFALAGLAVGAATVVYLPSLLLVCGGLAALRLARAGWRDLVGFAAGVAVVVAPLYLLALAVRGLWSYGAIHAWLTESSGAPAQTGSLGLGAVKKGVVGGGRSFLGGHFLLSLDSVRSFVLSHYPGKTLRPDTFLVAGMSRALVAALAFLAAVVAALFALLAGRWVVHRPQLPARVRTLALICVAVLVPVALLDFYWDPLSLKLWTTFWILTSLLLALPLLARRPSRLRTGTVVALVASLLAVNLLGSVVPQTRASRDYWGVRAEWYRTHVSRTDLVVANTYVWTSYLEYLTHARVLDAQSVYDRNGGWAKGGPFLLERIRGIHARRVFVSDEALHPFADAPAGCIEERAVCDDARTTRRLLKGRLRLVADTGRERIWQLR
jgi:hypothetical protein